MTFHYTHFFTGMRFSPLQNIPNHNAESITGADIKKIVISSYHWRGTVQIVNAWYNIEPEGKLEHFS